MNKGRVMLKGYKIRGNKNRKLGTSIHSTLSTRTRRLMKKEEQKRRRTTWTDRGFFQIQSIKLIAKGHWYQETSWSWNLIWPRTATTTDLEKNSPEFFSKLKTLLWKCFFLVRLSLIQLFLLSYRHFSSSDIVWDCKKCLFQWLQQLFCSLPQPNSAQPSWETSHQPFIFSKATFPKKKGVLYQQEVRKLSPPWVKGLCWIPSLN